MKKIFILTLGLLFSVAVYSQNYSYSFSGNMNPELISVYEKECTKFQRVHSVKLKYKPDSKKGEFIIKLDPSIRNERAEGKDEFHPTDIKKYILSKGLTPLEFRKIK